ncbi:MAG TPA: RsmB/NOP family class I SAM-dependent RNA methyltransferase [Casimicrobiaceae bacterium]|nr:RsmB/NOP family class I SAM-dependent RNA methyltransferase [Casimicrobiaceae bacterium]
MTVRANQVAGLSAAIERVSRFDVPADAALTTFFRANAAMGQRDRGFVAEGAYAYLRRKRSQDALAATTDPHKLALGVLVRELGFSVRDLQPVLAKDDAAWLADFKFRARSALPPAIAADLPDWLWERLCAVNGETEAADLARAFQTPAPLDLRVNLLKTTREKALAALRDEGFDASATPFAPLGIRIAGRPSLVKHPWLADGRLEVQDEGSQLIGLLVAPRRSDMVVDFCAGAGGKTLLLGALMRSQGRLYAFDVKAKRLAKLSPRLARSGLSNVHPQVIAHERDVKVKRLAQKIDRVLVDAPCTGFGTLRRNPDLKWRQTPTDVDELAVKQSRILAGAATLVKPGGRLVYATCSILPEENEAIVDTFVAAHPDFVQSDVTAELAKAGIGLDTGPSLRLLPHRHGCDGFFAAILERTK